MKTKEIKEMTREERKSFLLWKFKSYRDMYIMDILIDEKTVVTEFFEKEMKTAFNLLKNSYFMEFGEEINTHMVLRM